MKTTTTVLKQWATKVIKNVSNYDTGEGVVDQYNGEFETFYADMTNSKGWDKIKKEKKITNERVAKHHMLTLLEDTIEIQL